MSAYKIFVSSPGDVGRERHLAEQVICRVAAEFQGRVEVQPYFWEYEPMESTRDYQENIPLTSEFDLVICILWKRLGSPLSVKHERPDGGRWRSGTEFELVTAIESKKARGAPDIFIFKNDTKTTFEADVEGDGAKTELDLAQWKALRAFIKEWCEGVQDGQRVFTAALNRYQALDQFEQVLEKLLVDRLNERFPPPIDPLGSDLRSLRPPAPTWTVGSPFRGLEAFQFLHAPVFCGRTHAIGEVLDRLRRKAAHGRPFVLILGASGSGKSSLAMAGVLPLLVKPGTIEGVGLWRRVVFRPGGQTEVGDLFDRLGAALVRQPQEGEGLPELISGSTTVEQLAADLRAEPKAAALLVRSALNQIAVLYREAEAQKLRSWIAESQAENRTADVERYGRLLADLTPREARLALVIDQAEELFTSDDLSRPELRKDFVVALDALAASGVVFVLVTLRSDFYSQIQRLPVFVDLKEADGQFDLLPAKPAEIAQMIRQPAIAAGLKFEKDPQTQEGLDEVLADQVKAEPRLLPLLEFALDELYKQRTAGGLLTFEAYRVHLDGSIVRALAKRADATLEGLPELSRDAFRSVMRRLATTADDTAAGSAKGLQLDVIEKSPSGPTFQRQRVPYDQLTVYPPGAKALVDAFVAARLLVVETGKADQQKAEVTVAHEALFVHWAALKNLLLAERDDLILPRARVAASHERWRAENRAGDFLLPPGKQLSEAEQLLAEYSAELTPELKAYVTASIAQAHAQQKRRQRLLIGALVIFALLAVGASAAAIFGFWQKGEAEKQSALALAAARNAQRALSRSDVSRAEEFLGKGEAPSAVAFLARAVEQDPDSVSAGDRLWFALSQRSWPLGASAPGHCQSAVFTMAFSPDGNRIVIGLSNGGVQVWDTANAKFLAAAPSVHKRKVICCSFSPDGTRFVTGSLDATARIWDAKTGQPEKPVLSHQDSIECAAFSSDARYVATGSRDKTVQIWEVADGKPYGGPLQHDSDINSVSFHPLIGTRILATFGDVARIWNLTTRESCDLKHPAAVTTAQFNAAGDAVLTTCKDGLLRWWSTEGGQLLRTSPSHSGGIESASISPDSGRIASVSGAEVLLWGQDLRESVLLPHSFHVACTAFSRDGSRLLSATDDGKVRVWSTFFGQQLGEAIDERDQILGAAFTPDGKILIGTSAGLLRMWMAPTLSPIGNSMRHGNTVQTMALSPDEKMVLTGAADSEARIWDLSACRLIGSPIRQTAPVVGTAFTGNGNYFLTAAANRATLWATADREKVGETLETDGDVTCVAFNPDGQTFAAATRNGEARFWTVPDCKPKGSVMRHSAGISAIAFDPLDRLFLTASQDETIKTWDPESGNLVGTISTGSPVTCESLSPDNHLLAVGSNDGAAVYDIKTGHPINSGVMHHEGRVNACAFSPDGMRIATAWADGTAIVWDVTSGHDLFGALRHASGNDAEEIRTVAFSRDGKRLATGSADGTVLVWDATDGRQLTERLSHRDSVSALEFADNGKLLVATGARDGRVVVWDLESLATKEERLELAKLARQLMPLELVPSGGLEPKEVATSRDLANEFSTQGRSPASRLGYWLTQDPRVRKLSPFSTKSLRDYVGDLISDKSDESLAEAAVLVSGDQSLEQKVEAVRKGENH